ncbi:MAG: PAS domain S-box protein [Lentisphaerae bacterium]|nr:PAS domain S-box protein [Lentisphaerota bacterium]
MVEVFNTLLLIVLELTFILVVMLLLHSQRKSIGDTPFYVTMGMLLFCGQILAGANLSFAGVENMTFPIAPVVLFVPLLASVLLLYVTDGVLSAQRFIIGALVTMGIFFYLSDLTRLQMRWVTYSVTGGLPLEALDFLLERSRRSMLALVCGQLLALFIIPIAFSRLRNTAHNLFVCCFGALSIALIIDTLIYELLCGGSWHNITLEMLPLLAVRIAVGCYVAALLTFYIAKSGTASEVRYIKPLEILFAFFGSYSRNKLLEANLLEWEGRYRLILENASEMIVIIDRNGLILDVNKAAERMLGGSLRNGREFANFLSSNDAETFQKNLTSAASGSGDNGQFTVQLSGSPDEETNYLALTVTAFAIGGLQAFIIIGRDITGELRLEEERRQLNEELAHSQRLEALGQLAGGVAHDFNNNIHAILGHADLLSFKLDMDDKARRHLDKIIEIAEQSGQLTSQLLGFARKGKYRESDFDLRVLLQRTAELFLPGSKDIEFTVTTADKPLLVRGDQIQLQQVFLNLLINARDALRMVDDRERHLDVNVSECAVELLPEVLSWPEMPENLKNAVLLTIADNGCGMDENTLKRLFEPFFTTKPVGKGTGMGMAMAYGTIHGHHGAIGVESTPNEGTAIYIVLPEL